MFFVELVGHVEQAGAALKDSHRRVILLDMHDGRHAAVRIDGGGIPFGFSLACSHVQANVVVRDTDGY